MGEKYSFPIILELLLFALLSIVMVVPAHAEKCACEKVPPGKTVIEDKCHDINLCMGGRCKYMQDNGLPGYVGCVTVTDDYSNAQPMYTQEEVEVLLDTLTTDISASEDQHKCEGSCK